MATRRTEAAETGSPWTRLGDEAAVSDYLDMLVEELSGRTVNKAEHNRRLRAVLTKRSRGSIEFKHANISAAMIVLGYRYVDGYKPRPNYQELLRDVIEARMAARPELAAARRGTRRSVAPASWRYWRSRSGGYDGRGSGGSPSGSTTCLVRRGMAWATTSSRSTKTAPSGSSR